MHNKGVKMERYGLWWLVALSISVGMLTGCLYLLSGTNIDRAQAYPAEFQQGPFDMEDTKLYSTDAFTIYLPLILRYYPPPPSIFGVEMRVITHTQGLTEAQEAGVRWVRLPAFPWDQIESTPGVYNWAVVDEDGFQKAAENDMEVIAVVKYAPAWAQKVEDSRCGPIKEDALDDFARFLAEAVRRYSRYPYNVRYWELGNEPDVRANTSNAPYGCWGDGSAPYFGGSYYAEMLKSAYPAIKSVDANAKVIVGSLLLDCHPDHESLGLHCTAGRENSGKFLEGILVGGGGDYFDIVGFHAYAYPGSVPGEMWSAAWSQEQTTGISEKHNFLQGVLSSYGYQEKRLINTECALICTAANDDCLETQAMYVPKAYAEAIALDMKSQIYYAMNNPWNNTGLLWPDTLKPKPVYEAYKIASSYLGSVTYEGTTEYTGVEGYSFRSWYAKEHIDVVWTTKGVSRTVDLPGNVTVYDRYGDVITNSGAVEIGYGPVYIVEQP